MKGGRPILDAHIHLDPSGRPKEAVRSFLEKGGTHLVVVHKPYGKLIPRDIDDYRTAFDTTISMNELAVDTGAVSFCVLGPYPGELPWIAKNLGLEMAMDLQSDAIDLAIRYVREGKALGLGEVGRVHFTTDPEIQEKCDLLLCKAFKGGRELNCPVVLHTESFHSNPSLMEHLSELATSAGADKRKVIKHYSGSDLLDPRVRKGLSISLQCRRENLEAGLRGGFDFLLETDYIDDPSRPNVVMPPDTVPKKIKWAYDKGLMDEEEHSRLMIELPKIILGIDTEK